MTELAHLDRLHAAYVAAERHLDMATTAGEVAVRSYAVREHRERFERAILRAWPTLSREQHAAAEVQRIQGLAEIDAREALQRLGLVPAEATALDIDLREAIDLLVAEVHAARAAKTIDEEA